MAVEELVEEVAANLEEAAEATRAINTAGIGYFFGGVALGAAIGFYFGYRFNKEKIKAEAFKDAEVEIQQMREVYQQKALVAEPKPPVEEVLHDLGYSTERREKLEGGRPLAAPVPITNPATLIPTSVLPKEEWDQLKENTKRSPREPYVIHEDEFNQGATQYTKAIYTYFSVDDVIMDVSNNYPVPHADIVIGEENLKWGHGTTDPDLVFVRNDRLGLDIMITKIDKSYEEEVMGLSNDVDDDNDPD